MLSKKDVRYLIKVLKPFETQLPDSLIARLEKFEKTSPDLSEIIDVSRCDGTRLVQKKTKREGLEP